MAEEESERTAGARWLASLRARLDVLGAATGHTAVHVVAGAGPSAVGRDPSAALGLLVGIGR
jgi:hypothetical protein